MNTFLTYLISIVTSSIIVAGIVLQDTYPGLYNLAHFLAIAGGVISIIIFPLLFLGFTVDPSDLINKIMSDENVKLKYLKMRPFGLFLKIFGFIWHAFFIVLYASQGWYIVAFMFLVSFIFIYMTIPLYNQFIHKVHNLTESETEKV